MNNKIDKTNLVKLAASELIRIHQLQSKHPYKSLMDFLIIQIRDGGQNEWTQLLTEVFHHIVDNYDIKEINKEV